MGKCYVAVIFMFGNPPLMTALHTIQANQRSTKRSLHTYIRTEDSQYLQLTGIRAHRTISSLYKSINHQRCHSGQRRLVSSYNDVFVSCRLQGLIRHRYAFDGTSSDLHPNHHFGLASIALRPHHRYLVHVFYLKKGNQKNENPPLIREPEASVLI